MDEIIKIRCPYCSAGLSVKRVQGIETKNVTCPVCKNKSPFAKFRLIETGPTAGEKPIGSGPGQSQTKPKEKATQWDDHVNKIVGRLCLLRDGSLYQLKVGRNVIGRMAESSQSTIQLPIDYSRRVSREHLVIDVRQLPSVGYKHYLSLYKESVNVTKVNNTQINYGDEVILSHGQLIQLADVTLRFELKDSNDREATE